MNWNNFLFHLHLLWIQTRGIFPFHLHRISGYYLRNSRRDQTCDHIHLVKSDLNHHPERIFLIPSLLQETFSHTQESVAETIAACGGLSVIFSNFNSWKSTFAHNLKKRHSFLFPCHSSTLEAQQPCHLGLTGKAIRGCKMVQFSGSPISAMTSALRENVLTPKTQGLRGPRYPKSEFILEEHIEERKNEKGDIYRGGKTVKHPYWPALVFSKKKGEMQNLQEDPKPKCLLQAPTWGAPEGDYKVWRDWYQWLGICCLSSLCWTPDSRTHLLRLR